ncbi:MAG: hypothetical protein AAF970_12140 [Bacteroidota bacterium]
MDKQLQLLLHLYGEEGAPTDRRALLDDPELADTHQMFSDVKFRLDHQRIERPAAEVLDQVFQAAEHGLPASRLARADRAPVARSSVRRRRALFVGACMTVLLGLSLAVWTVVPIGSHAPAASMATMDAAPTAPAPADVSPRVLGPSQAALGSPARAQHLTPSGSWDAREDLLQVHERLETLEAFRLGQDASRSAPQGWQLARQPGPQPAAPPSPR